METPTPAERVVQVIKSHAVVDLRYASWRVCYRVGTTGMFDDILLTASSEADAFAKLVSLVSLVEHVDESAIRVERVD